MSLHFVGNVSRQTVTFRPLDVASSERSSPMHCDVTPGPPGLLADAPQDAGCVDEAVLNHCRGQGPHIRGCWVVDLVLRKS